MSKPGERGLGSNIHQWMSKGPFQGEHELTVSESTKRFRIKRGKGKWREDEVRERSALSATTKVEEDELGDRLECLENADPRRRNGLEFRDARWIECVSKLFD